MLANLAQIIKYEGDNAIFVWKHPTEDFNTLTQLVVHETQEAVFFMNGQALDLFGPGRFTLETQNIPLIRKILNMPTNDQSPFHCEVYFINKTEHMALKWGTDSHVQYMEPKYNFPLWVGASGELTLRVEDSRRLLIKIVGTTTRLDQTTLAQMFRAFLIVRAKPYLARIMSGDSINIFNIDLQMGYISEELHKLLAPDFSDYGLTLERFFVTSIVRPDGDKTYEKFKDLHFRQYSEIAEAQIRQKVGIIDQETEAQRTVIEAQGIAQKRQIEGYTYHQERSFEIANNVAKNEAVGQMSNLGIGLGMISGVAGSIGSSVAGIASDALGQIPLSPQQSTDDFSVFKQKLEKLRLMKDMSLINEEEFETEKKKMLSEL